MNHGAFDSPLEVDSGHQQSSLRSLKKDLNHWFYCDV